MTWTRGTGREHSEGACADLTEAIIGAAIEVHRTIGPGLLESTYEACLAREFELRGLSYLRQSTLSIEYKGVVIKEAYRIDLLVEDTVIVEVKAIESFTDIHEAQLLTYLRLARKPVGLLINFHTQLLRDGIRRFSL